MSKHAAAGLPAQVAQPGVRPSATPAEARMEREVDAFNALATIHRELEARRLRLEAGRGNVPICVEGCGRCCENNTPIVSAIEARYALASLAVPQKALARAREWLTQRVEGVTVYPEETPAVMSPTATRSGEGIAPQKARIAQLITEFPLVSGGPCPFLEDDTKGCMVHAGRPLACRAYGAVTTPDLFCQRPQDAWEAERPGGYSYDSLGGNLLEEAAELLQQLAEKVSPGEARTGLWPALLVAIADPEGFMSLVKSGNVPLAKVAVGPIHPYPAVLSQRKREMVIQSQHG